MSGTNTYSNPSFTPTDSPPPEYGMPPSYNSLYANTDAPSPVRIVAPAAATYVAPDVAAAAPVPSAPPQSRPSSAAVSSAPLPAKVDVPAPPAAPAPSSRPNAGATTSTAIGATTPRPAAATLPPIRTQPRAAAAATQRTRPDMIKARSDRIYLCFCELHKCYPFCKIKNKRPLLCLLKKKGCCLGWLIFSVLVTVVVVGNLELSTMCRYGYTCGDGKCFNNLEVCDGHEDCKDGRDEEGCFPRFFNVPDSVAFMENSQSEINVEMLRGDYDAEWFYIDTNTDTDTERLIWTRDNGVYRSGYDVDRGSTRVDLTILNVRAEYADLVYGVGLQKFGLRNLIDVTVIDSFSCDTSSITVFEGDTFTMTATASYYGSVEPTLFFYNNRFSGQLISDSTITSNGVTNTKTVTFNGTASYAYAGMVFTGHLLQYTPQTDFNNLLSSGSCSVTVYVQYSVRSVGISFVNLRADSRRVYLTTGSVLTCSAIGDPLPSYFWSCNSGAYNSVVAQFTVPAVSSGSMTCQCTATNVVDGETYTALKSLSFDTTAGAAQLQMTAFSIVTLLIAMKLML